MGWGGSTFTWTIFLYISNMDWQDLAVNGEKKLTHMVDKYKQQLEVVVVAVGAAMVLHHHKMMVMMMMNELLFHFLDMDSLLVFSLFTHQKKYKLKKGRSKSNKY